MKFSWLPSVVSFNRLKETSLFHFASVFFGGILFSFHVYAVLFSFVALHVLVSPNVVSPRYQLNQLTLFSPLDARRRRGLGQPFSQLLNAGHAIGMELTSKREHEHQSMGVYPTNQLDRLVGIRPESHGADTYAGSIRCGQPCMRVVDVK